MQQNELAAVQRLLSTYSSSFFLVKVISNYRLWRPVSKSGVWRLLDEQNRESAEIACNLGKCSKLSYLLLSTYTSPCLSIAIIHNYKRSQAKGYYHTLQDPYILSSI